MNHSLCMCDGCTEVAMPGELTLVGHKELCQLCIEDFEEGLDHLYEQVLALCEVKE